MVDSFDVQQEEQIARVLSKYFPGSDLWQGEMWFFSSEMLLAGDLHPLQRQDDFDRLDRFGRAVKELWRAYDQLSLTSKTAMSRELKKSTNAVPKPPDDAIEHEASKDDSRDTGASEQPSALDSSEPYLRIRHNLLRELVALHRAVHGHNPGRYRHVPNASTDIGMIRAGKAYLQKIKPIKKRATTEERDKKAQLVDVSRRAWERYTGKLPPKKSETSRFTDFVDDVIGLAGKRGEKGWSAESAMHAWAEYERRQR